MPSKPRPGVKGVYVELPEGLLALVQSRASQDRRPFKTTLIMLIEQALGVTPSDYQEATGRAEEGGSADEPTSGASAEDRGARGRKRGTGGAAATELPSESAAGENAQGKGRKNTRGRK